MNIKLGQTAPDLRVEMPDGRVVGLANFIGRPLVLVFVRHLG